MTYKTIDDLRKEILAEDPSFIEEINKHKNNIGYLNHIDLICLDEVPPKNQPWLWPGVIPLNAFTLFAGVGGLGKSQLLMFIAAAVSTGKPFRAGGLEHQLPQGSVLILTGEDSAKYSLSPRLRALNADLSKIHLIKSVADERMSHRRRAMALDQDLLLLRKVIDDLKNVKGQTVKLIIVDPIVNFSGKTRDYINSEVSNFLYHLSELADEYELSFILNKHLRKKDSMGAGSAIDEIAGSHAWANTARQVWIICRDHEDKNKILFLDGKSNIKKQMNGFAFNIKSVQILSDSETINSSKIEWTDENVTISPDEAVSEQKYEKSKIQTAITFIRQYLIENGQSLFSHIKEKALKKGISDITFMRAAREFEQTEKQNLIISRGVKNAKIYQLEDE